MEYVYVADFGDSVKIGYSTNVANRMKQLESIRGRRVKSLYYEKAERPTERQLHHHFRERRTEGEYFAIPFEDAKRILADAVANPEKYAVPKPKTRTSSQVKQRYNQKTYDDMKLRVPKGRREVIKAYCDKKGESVNGFICRLIEEAMERDQADKA